MKKELIFGFIFGAAFTAIVFGIYNTFESHSPTHENKQNNEAIEERPAFSGVSTSQLALVVCKDKKIYIVDLYSGGMVFQSPVVENLGRPTAIDFDSNKNLLYIGSELGQGQNFFDPLVVAKIEHGQYTLMRSFLTNANQPQTHPVYSVVLNPSGSKVYVGDANPNTEITVVLDSETGQILDELKIPISQNDIFSPDEGSIATLWPNSFKTIVENNRAIENNEPGGIAIGDLNTGEWVSKKALENNKDLNPPWTELTSPFLYINPRTKTLNAYDRNSGEVLNSFTPQLITGLYLNQLSTTIVDNGKYVALSMVDKDANGYVVLINIRDQKLVSKIKVGPSPTNIVLIDN